MKWVVEANIGPVNGRDRWVIVVPTDGMPWEHPTEELAEVALEGMSEREVDSNIDTYAGLELRTRGLG